MYFYRDLSNVYVRKDQFSEIIANMTKTLHMNTPEQTMNGLDIDDFNDAYENILSKDDHLIEQLQAQLVHNQMQRKQPRNYTRILGQSNTPAHWYKAPSTTRSVYFYDPNYRKYVQQYPINQSNSFSFTPRTKSMVNIFNTTLNHHQKKQRSKQNYHPTSPNISRQHPFTSSRLQSVPILPSINTSKQRNNEILKRNEKQIITKSKKKSNQFVMPPASQ